MIIFKCLIDKMMQNINKLMSERSSQSKEETIKQSTNMENSDSDVDIDILDVMDGDGANQLDLNDQSDSNMTCARVRILVHQEKKGLASTSTPELNVDKPVETSSPKCLPDVSNVKVEPKKSGRTHHDYTDQPVD